MENVTFDRMAGVLVGAACADALGAGYEFGAPLPPSEAPVMRGQGQFEPGEWTDDTAQLIAIALAAAEGHNLDSEAGEDAVAANFQNWYLSPARLKDIGVHSSEVFGQVSQLPTEGLSERFRFVAAEKELRTPGSSGGNGALMRTAAVAMALNHDPQAMVRCAMRIASITHADDLSSQSSAVWCLAIRAGLSFADPADIVGLATQVDSDVAQYMPENAEYWREVLQGAFGTSPADYYHATPGNGYCVTTLKAAWGAVTGTLVPKTTPGTHLQVAIENAVRGGGDTDTVACVAGALLGAMWGYSAVPLQWRRWIHGWPSMRDADLMRIADSIYSNATDVNSWPHAAHLDYSTWPDTQSIAVHPHDADVVLGGIDSATGSISTPGPLISAVVSLCRVGANDLSHLGLAPEDHIQVRLIDQDGDANPNLQLVMNDAADAIAQFRSEGKRVLLHCVAAQSRTPSVGALYSVRHLGIAPDVSLEEVRLALPAASPNASLAAIVAAEQNK